MHRKTFLRLMLVAVTGAALLSGCSSSQYVYSRQDRMLTAGSHNHFLELGPCGSPWNYDDQVNLLFESAGPRFEAGQLTAYQNGKIKIDSGYVLLDLTNQIVTIHLTFDGDEHALVPCKYNGVHKFIERAPEKGELTRQWLQDFYKTNGPGFYYP